jgi:hypothetical protein
MQTLMPTIRPTALVPIFGGFTLGSRLWDVAGRIPSLDLQLATTKSLVDATTGSNLVTHTRASSGTYVDSDGVLRSATTNLFTHSESISSGWGISNTSITSDAIASPVGTITADLATNTGGNDSISRVATVGSSATVAFSLYMKRSNIDWVRLTFLNGANEVQAWFNLSTGTIGTVNATGTATSASASIQNIGNGWYRCVLVGAIPGQTSYTFFNTTAAADASFTRVTGGERYIWGAQLEQSSTVGEYVPTTSTINSAPRFDHNPTTGESLGLLVEESRTNLSLYSEDFGNAIYSLTAATVSTNTAVAPDGTTTADTVNSSGTAVVSQSFTKAASAITYTGSLFIKGSATDFSLTIDDGTPTNRGRARFNLSTGTLGSVTNDGTFTGTTSTITLFPNDWYRLTVTTTTNTLTTARLRSFWTGAGTSINFWGAQLEAGSFSTSYIPTVAATVTRAADVASITGSNFGVTRTNLLVRSEEFDSASWVKASASITTNTTTAPDGTITADTYSGTGASGVRQSVTLTSGTVYTISFYVKSAGLGNDGFRLVIDGAQSSSNFTATSEWQRFTFTATSANTGARTCGIVRNTSGDNVDVLIWGAQLEVGSAVTPYIQSPSVFTSRASSGTYVGGNGLIQTAVTNLLLRSEEFDNAAWTKTRSSITSNTIVAPDGTLTGDKLVEDTTAANTHITRPSPDPSYVTGTTYTYSVFAQAAERTFLQLRVSASASFSASFNLSTGVASQATAGTTPSVTNVGNGWYRCAVTFTATATAIGAARIGLMLNETTQSYTGDGTSGIYIWGAQLEQASTVGEYIPTTSTINSAARYDHDPISLIGKGLLLEEARTNLLLQSENLSTTWTNVNTSEAINVATAPDGTTTADKLITNNGVASVSSYITQTVAKSAAATTYTYSVFAKTGDTGTGTVQLLAVDTASSANRATSIFSTVSGTIVNAASVNGTFTNASSIITPLADGWYRFSLTFTTGTETSINLRLYSRLPTTGNGSSGLLLWGAQLEAGAFATSYIPTVAATVTRAADISTSVATSVFENSWYRQDEGTVFVEASPKANAAFVGFNDGTTSNRIRLAHTGTTAALAVNVTGGALQFSINSGVASFPLNTQGKAALAMKASDFALVGNTSSVVTSTGLMPSINQATIGSSIGTTTFVNGTIKRLTYFPTRLGNEVLQRITQ